MPIANDMKHIAEGIEVSYGERAAFLSDLSRETHHTLKTFNREHQNMSTGLWEFLSSNRDDRQKTVASLLGKNQRELRAMAEKLAGNLRESTAATKKETGELLSAFHASHKAMAQNLRKSLSSEIKRQAGKVREMLAGFASEHQAKSDQVREEIYAFNKQLKSAVSEIRSANRSDQRQARRHWQNLARMMLTKRAGLPGRQAGKAVTAAKKIEAEFKQEKEEVAEAVSLVNLKVQAMRLISAAASGISLSRMAKTLGIPYIRLAKPVSELVKEGEIKKEDSKYLKA